MKRFGVEPEGPRGKRVNEGSLPQARSEGSARTGPIRFGRYILVEPLGLGGMAEVFRALVVGPEQFQRTLVVKRILPQLGANPAFVKMFIDEARLCGRLSHPNVIQVHEFGRCEDQYFIAMEYVHGRALNHVLTRLVERREKMPATLASEIIRQVCRGLAYAHALKSPDGKPLGIIHRDITPGNVMVAFSGAVKILDFGVARVESRFRRGATDPGHLKGKTGYFAPEQFSPETTDHRADIFSTGIILHELLTRKRLFKAPSAAQAIELIKSGPVAPPSRINPEVPPALDAIVLRALERDRDQRYGHAGEMADALESFLLEQRFASQELPKFLRNLFDEEPTNDRIRLTAEQLDSLLADRLPESAGPSSGQSPAGASAAAGEVVRNPSGVSQSVPPSIVLAQWPELGPDGDPPRPRRRVWFASMAIAATALGLFLVVGKDGSGSTDAPAGQAGSAARAAAPGPRPRPRLRPATVAPAKNHRPEPPSEARAAAEPAAQAAVVPPVDSGIQALPRAVEPGKTTAQRRSARAETPPPPKKTQRIRHALPIDPFAP